MANMDKYKTPRSKRLRNSSRSNVFAKRQTPLSTDVGVNLVGDNDQMISGRTPDGNMPVFECGNTTPFRNERPCYLAIIKRFNGNCDVKGNGKGIHINKKGGGDNIEAGGKIKDNAKSGILM